MFPLELMSLVDVSGFLPFSNKILCRVMRCTMIVVIIMRYGN